jgi:hypothetical protein
MGCVPDCIRQFHNEGFSKQQNVARQYEEQERDFELQEQSRREKLQLQVQVKKKKKIYYALNNMCLLF